ncbi:MAG: iron-containing alcohol dehydrogenase [candidate division FCPU426 bacterium]
MFPFEFHNPTQVIFGRGTTPRIGKATAPFGRRVLLLSGQGSARRSGLLDKVTDSLKAAGVEWVDLGGVRPNPTLVFAREAIGRFRREGLDAVVAVGGGSVLDTAKAVAAGARYAGDVWDFFTGEAEVGDAAPVTTVLTLAATGSEMNSGGVLTNEATQEKLHLSGPALFPRVSILDPENTFTVPRDQTVFGVVDAVIHLLEGYFNGSDPDLPLQDRLVEGLVQTLLEAADAALRDPKHYAARARLMWGATLALNGLTQAGTGNTGFPMHMLEHPLSALYDLPHGAGLAIVGPAWMRHASRQAPEKYAQFAGRVFGLHSGSVSERAEAGIRAFETWCQERGAPTRLPAAGIAVEDIPRIVPHIRRVAEVWGMARYTAPVIADILKLAA